MWGQLPIGPESVPEHADVTHQHLFTEDPVYSVSDLSEKRTRTDRVNVVAHLQEMCISTNEKLAATYLLIVRPKVTWTSAIRVFLTHLNTEQVEDRHTNHMDPVS